MQRECPHDMGIQTWSYGDGTAAGVWSCTQCARKFVPLDLAMEKDAERYRWLRARPLDDDEIYIAVDSARHASRWALGGSDPDGCDAAIDAAMAAPTALGAA
jgi:hypothetical protein